MSDITQDLGHKEHSIISIPWGNGKVYDFLVKKTHNYGSSDDDGRRFKKVIEGAFVDEAPAGLKPKTLYILKKILTQSKDDYTAPYAQTRERYDLIDFAGDGKFNLRSILACCNNTEKVREELNRTRDCGTLIECYTVEPIYTTLPDNKDIVFESMTPWERLSYVLQYANGIMQLKGCRISDLAVEAHRDVKVANGLIERGEKDFTVKINDLSTIYLQNEPHTVRVYDGSCIDLAAGKQSIGKDYRTIPFPLSPQNTAPEDIITDEDYAITEKVDVYALGMMLAGFFGYVENSPLRNPTQGWFKYCAGWNIDGNMSGDKVTEILIDAFKRAEKIDAGCSIDESWIEKQLAETKFKFVWKDALSNAYKTPEAVRKAVRELFIKATHVAPKERIDLDGFINEIDFIIKSIKEERSKNIFLYCQPESAYIYHKILSVGDIEAICKASENNFHQDGGWIRFLNYSNSEDGLSNKADDILEDCIIDSPELESAIKRQASDIKAVNGNGLVHALINLADFYSFESSRAKFGGIVRIFMHGPLTDKHLAPYSEDDSFGGITLKAAIEQLKSLVSKGSSLEIFIHSIEEPQISDSSWFRYVPIDASKQQQAGQNEPISKSEKSKKAFITNKNGLFIDVDGEIVYVSQTNPK